MPKSRSRKSARKQKKSARKQKSPRMQKGEPVFFEVWYENKPKVNSKLNTDRVNVKLDDDDEWLLTGMTSSHSIPQVKTWLRSLGTIKKIGGKQRLQVSY